MKYLKYFKQASVYEAYKNGSDYVLPNVSYIEETKGVSYEPKKAFMLRAKYNATPDNLVAFTGATNIASLKVNGNSITIEPIKNEINTFDVLGENISLDMETGTASFPASFPESYLIKSPATSWSFKAKDPNYVINENTYACMLGMMDGMTIVEFVSLEEIMIFAFTTNDGVTIEATNEFLAEMNMLIQSGAPIGFTLVDLDMNNETFVFIDTEHQTSVTTGGLSTYSFDSEGLYDVEIGLADPDMKNIQFAGTPLISIEIGDGITSIGEYTFEDCSDLTSVTIGSDVTEIGKQAFYNCSSLDSITIPNSVTSIGSEAFYNCKDLTGELVIPDSVTFIGQRAFYGCSRLTGLIIGSGVTSINWAVFQCCFELTSIVIPDGVTTINVQAFDTCTRLTSITCLATTAPSIQSDTFKYVKTDGTLYVPSGSDYSSWMSTDANYLGYYNWTIEYI